MKVFIILLLTLFIVSSPCSILHAERTKMKRELTFIVRNTEKVKSIATRFHITASFLAKLNRPLRKGQTIQPGKALLIPVWLKKKSHTDTKDSEEYIMKNYELDKDSLDSDINVDYICMEDIAADSLRSIEIDRDIKKIDKQIVQLNYKRDSMQGAPDIIDNNQSENENQIALRKMKIAKERHYGKLNIATGIDSIQREKEKMQAERGQIKMRLNEYEDLTTNLHYNDRHHDDRSTIKIKINEWGDDPNKGQTPIRRRLQK